MMKINDFIPDGVWYGLIGLNLCLFFVGMHLESPDLMALNLLYMAACYVSLRLKTDNE